MKERKLLQIWEITCSSAILAAYLEKHGWRCKVITRKKFHKHRCAEEFWDYEVVEGRALLFYLEVAKTVVDFSPSIVLVRQNYEILPLVKLLAPFTPAVLQFHGHEVRYRRVLPWQAKFADKIICSTRDIARFGEYYGTPVHPMFQSVNSDRRKEGTALFIRVSSGAKDCLEEARQFARDNNLELDVVDRTKGEQIRHRKMPQLLSKYEWYLDLKGLTSREVLSKTAIEFLKTTSPESPGKVLTDTGEIVTEFETTSLEDYEELLESLLNTNLQNLE